MPKVEIPRKPCTGFRAEMMACWWFCQKCFIPSQRFFEDRKTWEVSGLWASWIVRSGYYKGLVISPPTQGRNRGLFTEWLCCWKHPSHSLGTSGRVTTLLPQPLPTWIKSNGVDLSFGSDTRQASKPAGMERKKLWNERHEKEASMVLLSPLPWPHPATHPLPHRYPSPHSPPHPEPLPSFLVYTSFVCKLV